MKAIKKFAKQSAITTVVAIILFLGHVFYLIPLCIFGFFASVITGSSVKDFMIEVSATYCDGMAYIGKLLGGLWEL